MTPQEELQLENLTIVYGITKEEVLRTIGRPPYVCYGGGRAAGENETTLGGIPVVRDADKPFHWVSVQGKL